MGKLPQNKVSMSITVSREVAEVLKFFSNRSKLIDDILSCLLLDLSPEEIIETIKLTIDQGKAAEFLIKRKCDGSSPEERAAAGKSKESESKTEIGKKIDLKEWWNS